jgi:hypothetical protein
MGLNVSNSQIAQELGLCQSDSHEMGDAIRTEVYEKKPLVKLSGIAELDEVYIIAGHKGFPAAIKGRKPRRNRLKGARGRGTLATEKPPVFGMIARDGQVSITMLPDVKQRTIKPLILMTILAGTLINTDEYKIYDRLTQWGLSA